MLTMSGSYRIRPAEASDIPVLARHRAGMFRDMGQLAAHLNDSLERATASFLEVAMARGEYLAWVAEDGSAAPSIIGGAGV